MNRILLPLTAIILAGCAGISNTVYIDKTLPLESVVIARFSFEYGGIATYQVDEDEESGRIRGIIPGIVRAVNWISEMNQITLIQAEMSDASRTDWKARLDSMYESFQNGVLSVSVLPPPSRNRLR